MQLSSCRRELGQIGGDGPCHEKVDGDVPFGGNGLEFLVERRGEAYGRGYSWFVVDPGPTHGHDRSDRV